MNNQDYKALYYINKIVKNKIDESDSYEIERWVKRSNIFDLRAREENEDSESFREDICCQVRKSLTTEDSIIKIKKLLKKKT